jgi:hypothetical protein
MLDEERGLAMAQRAVDRDADREKGFGPRVLPEGSGGPAGAVPAVPGQRLAYVADMLEELKLIVARVGCPTLTGLLEVARVEAVLQSRSASSG